MKNIRPLALCKLKDNTCEKKTYEMDFDTDKVFIFLGEIPNMRGHCVLIGTDTNKSYIGYHTDCFRELTEEEV